MLIGVDGNEANVEKRVGVNEYAYQLLWHIYKLSDEWKDRHKFIIYLRKSPRNLPKECDFWQYKVIEGGGMWVIRKLMPRLFFGRPRIDVFFSPSHYLPPVLMMPAACAIMDLGYLKDSGQFKRRDFWQLKLWSAWSIIISKRIIAISNTTKRDIVRHYRVARGKVDVTLLGYDEERFKNRVTFSETRRVKNKYTIGSEYVLFLSTLKPSKNIEGLLEAWEMIEGEFKEVKLVIAGKKGWLFETIFEKTKELGIEGRVIFTGFVVEEDKPGLIAGAKVFVLPSFWEGFGLDVLNAMAVGVPTIVSDRGSLPEVVGEAGVVIDPGKPEEIAEAVKRVLLMNKIEYNRLVKRGVKRVKKFSWEKTARETVKILEKVSQR
jgi:glycosyltransferase involved in cell wall biosynthesis